MANSRCLLLLLLLLCLLLCTASSQGPDKGGRQGKKKKANKTNRPFRITQKILWTVRWSMNPYLQGKLTLMAPESSPIRWKWETADVTAFETPVAVFYTNPQLALQRFLDFMDQRGVYWSENVRLMSWERDGDYVALPTTTDFHRDRRAFRYYRMTQYILKPPLASFLVPREFLRRYARLPVTRESMGVIFARPRASNAPFLSGENADDGEADMPMEAARTLCETVARRIIDQDPFWVARWTMSMAHKLNVDCPAYPGMPMLVGPSYSVDGTDDAVAGPSGLQAGPDDAVAGPSGLQAGFDDAVAGPSGLQAEPSIEQMKALQDQDKSRELYHEISIAQADARRAWTEVGRARMEASEARADAKRARDEAKRYKAISKSRISGKEALAKYLAKQKSRQKDSEVTESSSSTADEDEEISLMGYLATLSSHHLDDLYSPLRSSTSSQAESNPPITQEEAAIALFMETDPNWMIQWVQGLLSQADECPYSSWDPDAASVAVPDLAPAPIPASAFIPAVPEYPPNLLPDPAPAVAPDPDPVFVPIIAGPAPAPAPHTDTSSEDELNRMAMLPPLRNRGQKRKKARKPGRPKITLSPELNERLRQAVNSAADKSRKEAISKSHALQKAKGPANTPKTAEDQGKAQDEAASEAQEKGLEIALAQAEALAEAKTAQMAKQAEKAALPSARKKSQSQAALALRAKARAESRAHGKAQAEGLAGKRKQKKGTKIPMMMSREQLEDTAASWRQVRARERSKARDGALKLLETQAKTQAETWARENELPARQRERQLALDGPGAHGQDQAQTEVHDDNHQFETQTPTHDETQAQAPAHSDHDYQIPGQSQYQAQDQNDDNQATAFATAPEGTETSPAQIYEQAMVTVAHDNIQWLQEWIQLLLHHSGVGSCPISDTDSAHAFSPSAAPSSSPDEDEKVLLDDVMEFLAETGNMSRQYLMVILNNGVDWLSEHYPELIDVLVEFATASITPAVCFGGSSSKMAKREVHERNNVTDTQQKVLCNKLLLGLTGEMWKSKSKRAKNHAHKCQTIDDMNVSLLVGSHLGDGTWSRVSYSFDRGKGHHIEAAHTLSRGQCVETSISLEKAYGSATVSVDRLDYFAIYDVISRDDLSDNYLFSGDKWHIKGYRIAAKCANSSKALLFEKDMHIDIDAQHRGNFDIPYGIWTANLKPHDWKVYQQSQVKSLCEKGQKPWRAATRQPRSARCSHLDGLTVRLKMGSGFVNVFDYAGTFDDLRFRIGGETLTLAEHPDKEAEYSKEVDLVKAFGSKVVDMKRIRNFRIVLEGRCTGSSKTARYEEYRLVNRWFNRLARAGEERELRGNVYWKKWKWSVPAADVLRHDPAEF
ncbi:putative enterotoxin [Ophiocordyceps camponoti-floridani]|uniref:Putative enterotoxin n=1 Tax=Ophiocordyceps camponoti-floridani TaxID=2030778 RepID=A0A8H4Q6B4_9HYPO|nr:putative enterotoxin [Ophiocordyceps camponoti-floridani]